MRTPGAIVLGLASVLFFAASAGAAIKPSPWPWFPEEPQGYYTQTWHDGFRAGEIAANQDMTEKILPDLNRHAGYRNPDIGPISDEEFQDGFRFAYQAVVDFRLHHVVNLDGAAYGWGSD